MVGITEATNFKNKKRYLESKIKIKYVNNQKNMLAGKHSDDRQEVTSIE